MSEILEPECKPFPGRPGHYQVEVMQLWTHYHDKTLGHLEYLAWNCGTEYCTEVEHLDIVTITELKYPRGVCVYCGMAAGTKDHLMPVTWTGESVRRGVLTVPACAECNSAIGDAYAPTITLRREIAHKYIRRRYKRKLAYITPTPSELKEYGPTLRASVVNGMAERQLVLDRLAWPPVSYDERACELSGIDAWESGLVHGID